MPEPIGHWEWWQIRSVYSRDMHECGPVVMVNLTSRQDRPERESASSIWPPRNNKRQTDQWRSACQITGVRKPKLTGETRFPQSHYGRRCSLDGDHWRRSALSGVGSPVLEIYTVPQPEPAKFSNSRPNLAKGHTVRRNTTVVLVAIESHSTIARGYRVRAVEVAVVANRIHCDTQTSNATSRVARRPATSKSKVNRERR